MANNWKSGADKTIVDVRPGGPGNNYKILDPDAMFDAPSGGGRARTTLWGRGFTGLKPRGFIFTGNPNDFTFNMSYPLTAQNFLNDVLFKCPFDARIRQRCDRYDVMTNYAFGMLGYHEATNNDFSLSEAPANGDGTEGDVKRAVAATATFEEKYVKVAHDDISKDTHDADINKVISIGVQRCAGDCGPGKSEEDEWLWVTDRDSTPGYSGNPVARLGYTLDKFVTRSSVAIDPFTAADAVDVLYLGDRIVVFSSGKAPAYASFTDILNGVTAPNLWSTSTGFSAISSPNFPIAAYAANASVIFAVGAGGRIWKSTDGAISFTLIDNAATTSNNLTCIDGQSEDLVYIGGASGTFLRIYKGSVSRLTVSDTNGTLTAQINTIRTPSDRPKEVYMGTAGGEVWRSRNATDTRPTYENTPIPNKGSGTITDMAFIGYRGDLLYIIQTAADNTSRVLRDYAGGIGLAGSDVEVIGNFTSPSNFKYNSIAMANVNFGITVGQIHESYGFIGNIRPNNV